VLIAFKMVSDFASLEGWVKPTGFRGTKPHKFLERKRIMVKAVA